MSTPRPVPKIRIVHQPSPVYRMRYKKENRSTFLYAENGSQLQGQTGQQAGNNAKKSVRKKGGAVADDTPDGTFPKIEIIEGKGPATLIVSCVSKNQPYYVHPHKLNGSCCKSGVAILNIGEGETQFVLSGISIEFTKQSEIEQSIAELKSKNVDPFNNGFDFDRNEIDLTQLRLCFQVYLRDSLESTEIIRDKYHILEPIVSNIICNSSRKATLLIERTSKLFATPDGDNEITIFLKRLEKDQKTLIAKFYDDSDWQQTLKITDIHYQSAFIFKPPKYKKQDIETNQRVWLKFFVPFQSEQEMHKFINEHKEEENENGEENEPVDKTKPDGKYESRVLEFDYVPFATPQKRKHDFMQLFDLNDRSEKIIEISEKTKIKLAKRDNELQKASSSKTEHFESAHNNTENVQDFINSDGNITNTDLSNLPVFDISETQLQDTIQIFMDSMKDENNNNNQNVDTDFIESLLNSNFFQT